ncbi:NAD-dependent epimerase/dehydratase family protein [Pelagibius sp.]|uniref:NAD-dependent epimerase/dehydratase family protein n=1 Tax=Pelagibius sp. TaxID=1931238 RepID=UPI002611395D|nr:NAD-dependent epimerase/dehydratase family protein [Pelagibius sp.]
MARVLVTGANGFIAAAVCRRLLAAGWAVRGTLRRPEVKLPEGVERALVDSLGGSTDWTGALADCQAVIHCAARVHVLREEAADPLSAFRRVNVEGSAALARQALTAGVKRLIYLSSIGAAQASEKPDAATPYQLSKLEAEAALQTVTAGGPMALIVLRPPLVYGPNAPGNFTRLARLLAKGLPLPLAGIANRRSLIYLDNLTSAIEAALAIDPPPAAPLAVCDGADFSTPDLLRAMGHAMGQRVRLWPCPPALLRLAGALLNRRSAITALTESLAIDNRPACEALGWTPPFGVEEALAASLAEGPDRP